MNDTIQERMREQFARLPKIVQDAILSADIEKHLRALSETHKLHLDQWEKLENEVTLTLLGFAPLEQLGQNIASHAGITPEIARALAEVINKEVFEPIRKELERGLDHPEAEAKQKTDAERLREQLLSGGKAIVPGTPPVTEPAHTILRGPANGAYKPGEPSSARKIVADDPYREPPL